MKQAWQRLMATERAERMQTFSTAVMILLFLAFWGVSFYVLVNSFG